MTDQREMILASACDLYLANGLDGFSMRKLAKEVGITAPAIYRHYDGREAVLADVVRHAHRTFIATIYRALEAPTALERMISAAQGYLDFALEQPRWFMIMFSGPERLGMKSLPEDIDSMGCAIHQFWMDRFTECMRAGILKEGAPTEISMTMWAHAHGMVQLFHQGSLGTDPDRFRELFRESGVRMWIGIATREFAEQLSEGGPGVSIGFGSSIELQSSS